MSHLLSSRPDKGVMMKKFSRQPRSHGIVARLTLAVLRIFLRLVFFVKRVDFTVAGGELVSKSGPKIIVVADHTSYADAIFMLLAIRPPWIGIGMAELRNGLKWPIINVLFELLGHIPIKRGDSVSGDLAVTAAVDALEHGMTLALCPQGKIVHAGDTTARWYPGFARFAKETGAKIYILRFDGAEHFWPTHDDYTDKNFNWSIPVRATYGPIIDPADYATVEEVVQATIEAHASMSNLV